MNIPASFFGMVLGIAGLAGIWRAAARLWGMPIWIGEAIMLLGGVVWIVLLCLYLRKWLVDRKAALEELGHPVLCCFVSLVFVATLLMALGVLPYSRPAALVLFVVGAAGQLFFGLYRSGQMMQGNRPVETTTPIMYLPGVAGNFVSATVAGALGFLELGWLFFGAGLLSWLALESVILHRLYSGTPLPPALRPTLGIQLAPPSVGCVAYLALAQGPPDMLAKVLFGYATFQALLLARLYVWWIREEPLKPSYWAFTFGVAAFALSSLLMTERGVAGPIAASAPVLFVLANFVIGIIAAWTVVILARGQLVPPAGAAPVQPR